MSYCRWSCLNGYSDVYVYEDASGGWTTHVAKLRIPPGCPADNIELMLAVDSKGPSWSLVESLQRMAREWRDANPPLPVNLPEAGESFNHGTPGECADNLERLKAIGFVVPLTAILSLREHQREMDGAAFDRGDA